MTQADSVHSTPPLNTSPETLIKLPQQVAGERLTELATQQRRAEKTRQRVSKLREKAFREIERLIAFLDASDGYTMDEREEAVDDVPCDERELEFSFCGVTADHQPMPTTGYDDEREAGDAGDNEDDEPSLAAPEDIYGTKGQTFWAQGDDSDLEDEHDGAEPDDDAEVDKADDEPSLGWTVDGSFVSDDDREAGVGPRLAQHRTNLNTTITVECNYRKFISGLTDGQKAAVRPRITDSGVLVR